MTALDSCEPQIIRALEKAGWRILVKPYPIMTDTRSVLADFSASHLSVGQTKNIVVMEVKCFLNPKSDLTELYSALGQYQYYRVNLRRHGIALPLYLAIPDEAYQRFLEKPSFIDTFNETQVKLLIVNVANEEITQWID